MQKKGTGPRVDYLLMKNPYFLSDQADDLMILPSHELSTLTNFYCNRAKIMNLFSNGLI